MKISTEQDRQRILAKIAAAELPAEVQVKPWKDTRSAHQLRLCWLWNTVIGNETGEGKDAVHTRHKEKYLVPIFTRDDQGYAEMIEAVRTVWKRGMKTEAAAMKRQIVALTSTADADVHQMAEYLNEIERGAAEQMIVLPRPEDLYHPAMQK